jgi:hypothetical protein
MMMDVGLIISIKKYKFDVIEVEYLGMIFTQDEWKILQEKVDKILEWPVPMDKTGVKGFLGIAGYVREYLY